MPAATRSVPRFLPTLTEVVHPSGPTVAVEEARLPVVDPEALLERVHADVDAVLQRQLESTVTNALLDQVAVIVARIRDEIEPLVRQAVADAVAAEIDTGRPR